MTLKRVYINLILTLLLVSLGIWFEASNVSKLSISWTKTLFWITVFVSITTSLLGIFYFKSRSKDEEKVSHHIILDWVSFVSISMMSIVMIFMFVLLPTNVDGKSMESTLIDGERILMYHFNYVPERDDVVIVHIADWYYDTAGRRVNDSSEYDDPSQVYFVKRVAAIPGDTVTFVEINSSEVYHILINGVVYQNMYAQIYEVDEAGMLKMMMSLDEDNQLKDDFYFCFGDNESFSYDSRNIGGIHVFDMVGKAIYKLSPLGGI